MSDEDSGWPEHTGAPVCLRCGDDITAKVIHQQSGQSAQDSPGLWDTTHWSLKCSSVFMVLLSAVDELPKYRTEYGTDHGRPTATATTVATASSDQWPSKTFLSSFEQFDSQMAWLDVKFVGLHTIFLRSTLICVFLWRSDLCPKCWKSNLTHFSPNMIIPVTVSSFFWKEFVLKTKKNSKNLKCKKKYNASLIDLD